jgi:hypothetical protein
MVDANGDFRADRVRLTYSERIRHAADRDGHYPVAVVGYRIRSLATASGRTLLVYLIERKTPDGKAQPAVRYRRTTSKPVRDGAGNQAVAQLFRRVRAHAHVPPSASTAPPATGQPPSPAPVQQDADHDGAGDAQDCAPRDPAVHPGAPDLPDLSFIDSNCDGIDGTASEAIFVSPAGNDANPGTKVKPKLTIQAAVATVAAGNGKYVLVAAGTYSRLDLDKNDSGIGVYGDYDPKTWSRGTRFTTIVRGTPEGVLVVQATGVVLQLLAVAGVVEQTYGASTYGIRALDRSRLTLQHVFVFDTGAVGGRDGTAGAPGANGGAGGDGLPGACDDTNATTSGGMGWSQPGRATRWSRRLRWRSLCRQRRRVYWR